MVSTIDVNGISPLSFVLLNDSSYVRRSLTKVGFEVVNSLLSNEVNSKDGLNVCVESPFERNHNLNLLRRGVLRQYFGMNRQGDK